MKLLKFISKFFIFYFLRMKIHIQVCAKLCPKFNYIRPKKRFRVVTFFLK